MDGTHHRMAEALDKGCDIFYLCLHWDQTHLMARKMLEVYSPYGMEPHKAGLPRRLLNFTPKGTVVIVEPLSATTYEKLLGFRGCVLVHPDTYQNLLNPKYNYKNVQEVIVHCNMRHKPWRD